jgi:replication factor C large subunit
MQTAVMLLGVSSAAGGHGIHERITSPGRWQRMAAMRQQRGTRIGLMSKLAGALHMPQQTLRQGTYLQLVTRLIDADLPMHAISLDADQLEMILHDRARVQSVMKELELEQKEAEKLEKAREAARKKKEKAASEASDAKKPPSEEKPPATEEDTAPEKKRGRHTQATLF